MNNDITADAMLDAINAWLAADEDRGSHHSNGPSPAAFERFARMVRRTGQINGATCFIDQTPWDSFVLHGFLAGTWRISAVRHSLDAESDAIEVKPQLVTLRLIPQVDANTGVLTHVIEGPINEHLADEFFDIEIGLVWKAEREDGILVKAIHQ